MVVCKDWSVVLGGQERATKRRKRERGPGVGGVRSAKETGEERSRFQRAQLRVPKQTLM